MSRLANLALQCYPYITHTHKTGFFFTWVYYLRYHPSLYISMSILQVIFSGHGLGIFLLMFSKLEEYVKLLHAIIAFCTYTRS